MSRIEAIVVRLSGFLVGSAFGVISSLPNVDSRQWLTPLTGMLPDPPSGDRRRGVLQQRSERGSRDDVEEQEQQVGDDGADAQGPQP